MINHRSGDVKFLKLDRISSKGKTLLSELETDHPQSAIIFLRGDLN